MTTKIIDDYADIAQRLRQLENKNPPEAQAMGIDDLIIEAVDAPTLLSYPNQDRHEGAACLQCRHGILRSISVRNGVTTFRCNYCGGIFT